MVKNLNNLKTKNRYDAAKIFFSTYCSPWVSQNQVILSYHNNSQELKMGRFNKNRPCVWFKAITLRPRMWLQDQSHETEANTKIDVSWSFIIRPNSQTTSMVLLRKYERSEIMWAPLTGHRCAAEVVNMQVVIIEQDAVELVDWQFASLLPCKITA